MFFLKEIVMHIVFDDNVDDIESADNDEYDDNVRTRLQACSNRSSAFPVFKKSPVPDNGIKTPSHKIREVSGV